METERREFGVNRRWIIFYLGVVAFVIVVFAILLMIGCYGIVFRGSIGDSILALVGMVLFGSLLVGATAVAESLVRALFDDGPALIVSDQGVRYRLISQELIPWWEIRSATISYGAGIKLGVILGLHPGFSETLSRCGALANYYRVDKIVARFRFIDAPRAEVERELVRRQISAPNSGARGGDFRSFANADRVAR